LFNIFLAGIKKKVGWNLKEWAGINFFYRKSVILSFFVLFSKMQFF